MSELDDIYQDVERPSMDIGWNARTNALLKQAFAEVETPVTPALPRSSWTAADLLGHEFPPQRYAVPGLLAEGLNLLAGAPKLGKSWLAMNVAAAVAYGGVALDKIDVDQGEALYLALEDPPRRLQRRLKLVLSGEAAPEGLFFETVWPRLLEGGWELLDERLGDHPDCRLVVVDVFAKVRGVIDGNLNRYEADYAAMASLKVLADKHSVALLVVHHTRKASADDYVDVVSGTHGLAGAADAVLVLSRSRGSADAKLQITGRDVEEAEYAMQFESAKGIWSLLEGPAEEYEVGETRRKILAYLRENEPATPKTIAEKLNIEYENVKKACQRMAHDDQVGTSDGTYYHLSPVSPVSPVSRVSPMGQEGHEGQGPRLDGQGGFGGLRIDRLQVNELGAWRKRLPERSAWAITKALRQVLNYAVRAKLLDENPAKLVPNPEPKRREVLTFEWVEDLEAIAAELSPAFAPIPLFVGLTGLRPEEWLALERGDVDRRSGIVHVRRVFVDGQVKLYGKQSGSLRAVPLPVRAPESLAALPPRLDTALLFPGARGGFLNLHEWRRTSGRPR